MWTIPQNVPFRCKLLVHGLLRGVSDMLIAQSGADYDLFLSRFHEGKGVHPKRNGQLIVQI